MLSTEGKEFKRYFFYSFSDYFILFLSLTGPRVLKGFFVVPVSSSKLSMSLERERFLRTRLVISLWRSN